MWGTIAYTKTYWMYAVIIQLPYITIPQARACIPSTATLFGVKE